MIRTQMQFTSDQISALRQLSAATGRSIADLTRDAVEEYVGRMQGPDRTQLIQKARTIAGRFGSGTYDVSAKHDEYLAGAFDH